jgi:hypothetical protein
MPLPSQILGARLATRRGGGSEIIYWQRLIAAFLFGSAVVAGTATAQTLRIGLAEDPDILDPTQGRTFVGRRRGGQGPAPLGHVERRHGECGRCLAPPCGVRSLRATAFRRRRILPGPGRRVGLVCALVGRHGDFLRYPLAPRARTGRGVAAGMAEGASDDPGGGRQGLGCQPSYVAILRGRLSPPAKDRTACQHRSGCASAGCLTTPSLGRWSTWTIG